MTTDNLPALMDYCVNLASADMVPQQYRNRPANVLYAVEYADALNIPRINALTGIHVIEGKPSAGADLIAGLIRKAGHKLRVRVERAADGGPVAVAEVIRSDDPDYTFSCRWDMTRANAANLTGKANWKKFPEAMLKARAITEVAREAASDALMGVIYTPEELGAADTDADGVPVQVTSERVTPTPRQQQPRRAAAQGSAADAVNARLGQQQEPPQVTAEGLLQELEDAKGDPEKLRLVWRKAGLLPEADGSMIRAMVEGLMQPAQEQQQAPEPTPEQAQQNVEDVLEGELVEEAAAA